MKRKILFTIIVIGLGAVAAGAYLFNKPRPSVSDMTPQAIVEAKSLVAEFESDELKSNEKYLGKVIEVTGIVDITSKNEKGEINITLRGGDLGGVGCQFEKNKMDLLKNITTGNTVTIKGICTGILIDVVLVDCVISG